MDATWPGRLIDDRASSAAQEGLADAARDGDWDRLLGLLEGDDLSPNSWRPSGRSMFAPLHQAAYLGAPVDVVGRLIELGAWRTMRTADGERPFDLARRRGHPHLLTVLEPEPLPGLDLDVLPVLDAGLARLVESRIRPHLDVRLRHPQCEVLTEIPAHRLWYPVPGMSGGFSVELREDHLFVESWSRLVTGSGQSHVVTAGGTVLVREGFV